MSVIKPEIDALLDKTEHNRSALLHRVQARLRHQQHGARPAPARHGDPGLRRHHHRRLRKGPPSPLPCRRSRRTPWALSRRTLTGTSGAPTPSRSRRSMTERLCLVHYHEIGLKERTAPRSRTSSSPTCTARCAAGAWRASRAYRGTLPSRSRTGAPPRSSPPTSGASPASRACPSPTSAVSTSPSTVPPPCVRSARRGSSPPSRSTRGAPPPTTSVTASR